MGDKTGISWTDATWNPLRGCTRVSAGCENCYAENVAHRFSGPGLPYEGLTTERGRWNGSIKLVPNKLWEPLRWTRPRRVFVNSMSDLFHPGVPFEYVAAVYGVMAACPRHTFQVLTKRPERALEFYRWLEASTDNAEGRPWPRLECCWSALAAEVEHHPNGDGGPLHCKHGADPEGPWPLPNVWLGVSAEDQPSAEKRIPLLLQCPAAVRFVSAEPLLESVALPRGLDWVIAGGESGFGARPFNVQWALRMRDECLDAGVPFFFKQLGARPHSCAGHDCPAACNCPGAHECGGTGEYCGFDVVAKKGDDPAEWPAGLRIQQFPGEATPGHPIFILLKER